MCAGTIISSFFFSAKRATANSIADVPDVTATTSPFIDKYFCKFFSNFFISSPLTKGLLLFKKETTLFISF